LNDSDLMPYQVEGRDRILTQDELYLGDDPGLGKTAQVIRACAKLPLHIVEQGIAIVCPASLRENWKQEWIKWEGPDCERYFISYHQASADCYGTKHHAGLLNRTWGLIAFDECHALKNTKSKRMKSGILVNVWREKTGEDEDGIPTYQFVRTYGVKAIKTVMMSGTPLLNSPVDIFPALRHLDPNGWSSKSRFEQRYCDGHTNKFGRWDNTGSSNTKELKQKLVDSGLVLRRLKKNVLTELPDKRRQILHLEGLVKNTKACNSLMEASLKANKLTDEVSDLSWETKALEVFDGKLDGHVTEIRMELGKAKVKPCIDYIIEQEGLGILPKKLVVFAHHRAIIEEVTDVLNKKGIESARYYGGMNDVEKNNVVQRFQRGSLRVFVGSIASAGVGLTLTAASTALIIEPSYVPAENIQAEDRIHRIGATEPVLIQYVALANSMDSRILGIVIDKLDMINEIMS